MKIKCNILAKKYKCDLQICYIFAIVKRRNLNHIIV